MDGIDNGVQYDEGLEDGFFKSFQRYEPISVVEAFQALCLQEYDKVLKGKMGEEWQPSVGRMVKDMELNAMKKESDVWMLLSQLSEERMKRAKDNSHKSIQKSSKPRFNEADAPRVDDKMTILDALEQDEILKEVDIIVKWLENQYGGLSPESASRRGSTLQSPSHSTLSAGFTSKKSSTTQTTAGNLHTSLIASDAPAIASRLDINGKLLQNSAQSRDSTSQSSHTGKDGNSSSVPQTASAVADQQLSQQIWRLFRGGQLDMVKNMLAKGGQSARFSTFASLASGLSGAFSDPNLIKEARHLYPSLQGEPTIPSNSLSNIMADTSSAWPYSTTLPSGIVHRSLMKNTMATISTQTLPAQGSSELGQGKSSTEPSSSAPARASSVANLDPYERALYSCLSGFIGGVLPVCETWEDFVWVYLKTWLHQRIETILSSRNSSNGANFSYNSVAKGELVWSTPAPSAVAFLPSIASILSTSKFSEQLGEATSVSSAHPSSGVGLSSKKSNMDVDSDDASDDSETNLSQSSSSIALEGLATSVNLPTTKSLGSVLESVFASSGRSSAFTPNSTRDKSANSNLTAYTSPTDSDMLMARLSEYLKSLEACKLPPFQVPNSASGNTSNTMSSTNVLKRVSIEAKEAFRNIESFIILQSWHQLFRYLRQLCSQVIETANGGVNMMADTQHFNNPSHLLRFATHLVLVIRLIYPHIYDEDGTQKAKATAKNLSSFGASKFSTLGQNSVESTLSEDASFIITKYVEHLMDKEGCRHLVAHYCANMPPNCTQLGYELYVTMMRRIKTTKERQQVIEEAGEAGLDSFLIASLLVEDTINDPSSIESLNLASEPDLEPSHAGTGFSKSTFSPTPSRAGSQLKPLLPSSHGKPMSMKLTSRAAMDVAEETPSKALRSFGTPGASFGVSTPANAAPRPKESWISLLLQSEPTEYLQKLISLAASCHPSTVASTLTPTSISSTKSATTLIGEGIHRPSAADVERIHALEWLALSDSDEKQKLLCLKHANALARCFILSSSFAAARLLINTVNHLLSGLFTQHSLARYEEEDDHDLSVEDFNNEEDEEDELSPEANSAFSSSPRALLKEFMSMSTFLEAIESFSRWYHEGYGKDKSTNWLLRANASSVLQRQSAADYELFNDHHYDEDMEELNAAIPSDLKAKQKSSKLSNAVPVSSTSKPFTATMYHATAAEAIEKLGQVIYYPNGWLNDGSNLLASQTAQRAVATLLKNQLVNREDMNLPKSRAAQMSLLLHLCIPSSLLLLQHALMCTARLSDAVLLCNDLASDTTKLFMHCSSLSIQTFLMNVHLSSLFHLKAVRSMENGSGARHSDQQAKINSNIPFPF